LSTGLGALVDISDTPWNHARDEAQLKLSRPIRANLSLMFRKTGIHFPDHAPGREAALN
jgi:hypothetical protein